MKGYRLILLTPNEIYELLHPKYMDVRNTDTCYLIQKFAKYKLTLGWDCNRPKGLIPLDDDKNMLVIR
jgi:hypothetical protein